MKPRNLIRICSAENEKNGKEAAAMEKFRALTQEVY
jgi:hypothetical protein